jgi:hypothetical protein
MSRTTPEEREREVMEATGCVEKFLRAAGDGELATLKYMRGLTTDEFGLLYSTLRVLLNLGMYAELESERRDPKELQAAWERRMVVIEQREQADIAAGSAVVP